MKKPRQLERVVKGFANHRRIEILNLLEVRPELAVFEITKELKINFRTASDHIHKMAVGGLVMKRNQGPSVRHALTEQGKQVLKFLKTLD